MRLGLHEGGRRAHASGQAVGDVIESVFATSSIADTSTGGTASCGTAVVGITTAGTDTTGMTTLGAHASVSGTVVKRARGKRSRCGCGSVSLSKEAVLSGGGEHVEVIAAESGVFPMVERTVNDSGVSGFLLELMGSGSALPWGRRAGKGQCGETSCNARP